jgi:hypothetical protein
MSVSRITLLGVILAMLALMLGACMSSPSTPPLVFDESVPPEESVWIGFSWTIQITSYNGIPVPVKKASGSILGYLSEWHSVILPAGEIEFVFDIGDVRIDRNYHVAYETRNIIYKFKDVTLRYTFEPQLHYSLIFNPYGGSDENTLGIEIYLLPEGGLAIKENMIDFLPLRGENKGTVLE